MQFSTPAPGLLTSLGGGNYRGTWNLDGVSGMTRAEASSWINSALNDALGWGRAGVSFQEVSSGGSVSFNTVAPPIKTGSNAIGYASHSSVYGAVIVLDETYQGNMDLVNHEAAHAFFYAEHSPEGSDSIEEPIEDPGEEWPSTSDIAQVRAWLGLPPDPDEGGTPPDPTIYFFPGGLESYITNWEIPAGARARLTATVTDPAPAVIRPVYAASHEAMLSGDRHPLCRGIGTDVGGWHETEWQDARSSGDLYVALIVEAEEGVSMDELNIAHAEVQLSGTGDDSSRSIAN